MIDVSDLHVTVNCPTCFSCEKTKGSEFDRDKMLRVLVSSLLSQTHKNWDLILVHDGSESGNFEEIMNGFKDERIKWSISEKRLGGWGFPHRNKMLDESTGDFILFTNDDSYYVPFFMEEMLATAVSNLADAVYCDLVHSCFVPSTAMSPPRRGVVDSRFRGYGDFGGRVASCEIDLNQLIVRRDIASKVRFEPESDGKWASMSDWNFIRRLQASGARFVKRNGFMCVHN